MRRAVDDEVPGAVKEETGPAAVRRVPPGPLNALRVYALGPLGIVVVVRDVGPHQLVGDDVTDAAHVPRRRGALVPRSGRALCIIRVRRAARGDAPLVNRRSRRG